MSDLFNTFFTDNDDNKSVKVNKNSKRIAELVSLITKANDAYRKGNAIITDSEYDSLVDELEQLDAVNPLLVTIGVAVADTDSRKEKLPVTMASMNKIKTMVDIQAWAKSKNIHSDTIIICTPKFDGLSLLNSVSEKRAWTRGDGTFGQNSNQHFAVISKKYKYEDKVLKQLQDELDTTYLYTTGEIIIHKNIFAKRHADNFKNGRNRVAGLLNDYKPENDLALNDCLYIRYGLITEQDLDKKVQLDILNKYFNGWNPVKYHVCKLKDLTVDILGDLYNEWSQAFEIDGIIVEVNDAKLRNKLGLETSTNNPCYARAYKGNFEQVKETTIENINWEVSKQGYLIPVAQVTPIDLDGATVSNVTLNNAKNVVDLKLGINSIVKIKRSGMVIPLITEVVKSTNSNLPIVCPSCGSKLVWNKTNTHIMCNNVNCTERKVMSIVGFFDILDVDGLRETTVRAFVNAGFDTVEKILRTTKNDMLTVPGFAQGKADNIYNAIQEKINDVELCNIQHASNMFQGLGSKKLKLLEHFDTKPSVNEVCKIQGFSITTAEEYVNNYDRFFAWVKTLPITIKKNTPKVINTNGKFYNQTFVFTGVRSAELEDIIINEGGNIGSGVNKNTTYLVMKQVGSGSSKEQKAQQLGVKIITIQQLEQMCK